MPADDLSLKYALVRAGLTPPDSDAVVTAIGGHTVQITGNLTITAANAGLYNGNTLEFTGGYTVTLSAGLPADFGFAGMTPAGATATIASDGTALLQNGAGGTPGTGSVARAAASYAMFAVTQRNTNQNSYVVN